MKTIKQIADELGVSKQKVYRFIVRNHITASSEVKQSKLYDEATEMLIKQGILEDEPYQKSHHEAHQNHINDTVSEAVIELLRKELEQKNEQLQEKDRQIREKDQQISEMQAQLSMNQKLMDQEQGRSEKLCARYSPCGHGLPRNSHKPRGLHRPDESKGLWCGLARQP